MSGELIWKVLTLLVFQEVAFASSEQQPKPNSTNAVPPAVVMPADRPALLGVGDAHDPRSRQKDYADTPNALQKDAQQLIDKLAKDEDRSSFLFDAIAELRKWGMDIRSFEDGLTTNQFMAFIPDDHKLVIGGPTENEAAALAEHKAQLKELVLTLIAVRRDLKGIKITDFKIVPGNHFAKSLTDTTLTIWWPVPNKDQ